jgi:hypothetical protein
MQRRDPKAAALKHAVAEAFETFIAETRQVERTELAWWTKASQLRNELVPTPLGSLRLQLLEYEHTLQKQLGQSMVLAAVNCAACGDGKQLGNVEAAISKAINQRLALLRSAKHHLLESTQSTPALETALVAALNEPLKVACGGRDICISAPPASPTSSASTSTAIPETTSGTTTAAGAAAVAQGDPAAAAHAVPAAANAWVPAAVGTAAVRYRMTHQTSETVGEGDLPALLVCISAQQEHASKCPEELRMEDYRAGNKGPWSQSPFSLFNRLSVGEQRDVQAFRAGPTSTWGSHVRAGMFAAPSLHSAHTFGVPPATATGNSSSSSCTVASGSSCGSGAAVPGSLRALCTPEVMQALQCKLCVIKTTAEHAAAAAATQAPLVAKEMTYDARYYEGEPNEHWSVLHDQLVRAVWKAYEQELGVATS